MKKRIYLLFSLIFLFGGCAEKSSLLDVDSVEQSMIINTKKGELYSSLEIKSTIFCTYLNGAVSRYKDSKNEMFLVSIYIDKDSSKKDESGIYNKDYKLTMNTHKPISIKELKYQDDLIKLLPVRSHWSKYYLVGFKDRGDSELIINFKSDAYGEVALKFLKAL
jgi:phage anti-repressor protein